jgi:hypothetical protein
MPLSEIAVLYTVREPYENEKEPLPQLIGHALEKKGILSSWISEDFKAKKSYDITTNRATISTIQAPRPGLRLLFLLGRIRPKYKNGQRSGKEPDLCSRPHGQGMGLYIPYSEETFMIESLMRSRQ